jgi:hypothetical protein
VRRRARSAGIRLAAADAPIARGMIRRGDRISDICSYFGINPGRLYDQLAELPSGEASREQLPPPGPYVVRDILSAVRQLERCLNPSASR